MYTNSITALTVPRAQSIQPPASQPSRILNAQFSRTRLMLTVQCQPHQRIDYLKVTGVAPINRYQALAVGHYTGKHRDLTEGIERYQCTGLQGWPLFVQLNPGLGKREGIDLVPGETPTAIRGIATRQADFITLIQTGSPDVGQQEPQRYTVPWLMAVQQRDEPARTMTVELV